MIFKKIKDSLAIVFVCAPLLVVAQEQNPEADNTLADQLYALAEQHNFIIRGINIVGDVEPRKARGKDPARQLEQLLDGYNYALVRGDNQQLQRLIIIKKTKLNRNSITLDTRRRGKHHLINASLQGYDNGWLPVELLVDTGADRIVVSESVGTQLGYDLEQLESTKLQTANGITTAKITQLKAISLGNKIIRDVDIAFVADDSLNNIMLLGMNVLSQYRLTIDDKLNRITLFEK